MNHRLSYWIGHSLRLSADFVAAILVGTFIGRKVDFHLNTEPFGLVICILFGIIAGSLAVYRSAKKIMFNRPPNIYED